VTPRRALEQALTDACERALGIRGVDPLLTPSAHADYQANFAMSLAKRLNESPRAIAERVIAELDLDARVAGPGFVNLTVSADVLAAWATEALADERLGVKQAQPKTVVLDYSAPNVAKEMHVGHLRSTVIGDALARTLGFLGHAVDRQNHLGDWGTQFGMLVEHMLETGDEHVRSFAELGELYRDAKRHYDEDAEFAVRARERVVALQAHDPRTTELWQGLVDVSVAHMDEVYDALGVLLTDDDIRGESFYNDMLDETVDALLAAGAAYEHDGAVLVASERFRGKEGEPAVLIVRKSDGGYGYPATDFATLRYSVDELHGDRLVYVTDARQAQHFAIVFEVCERVGWLRGATAEHVPFGMVLGDDRRPFKTRDGGTVPLAGLLAEAVSRAQAILDERGLGEDAALARAIGIGAVKWADLSSGRQHDYVFSFERMLALRGNTAPYVQYAHVRAMSVLEKGGTAATVSEVAEPAERALVLQLAGFSDALAEVEARLEPHRLCGYLYELAGAFTEFYDACPIVGNHSRLALTELTGRTLRTGLGLLGISAPERM
jgi:arginyl-tRNA synthetase